MKRKAEAQTQPGKKLYSVIESERAAAETVFRYNELLRSKRLKLGLIMQQVARLAGISLAQYQKFEYGKRQLSTCSMRVGLAVCAALQIDPPGSDLLICASSDEQDECRYLFL